MATIGYVPNAYPPEVMRGVMEQALATADVLGHDEEAGIVLAVAVEPCLFAQPAAFNIDLEDREPEPPENDDAV